MVNIPVEMFDFIKVLQQATTSGKYPENNWLEPEGIGTNKKHMHSAMFRHLAESYSGSQVDKESGLHPLLHLACRAMMSYCRQTNNIINSQDNV